jgi:hypothetical protein
LPAGFWQVNTASIGQNSEFDPGRGTVLNLYEHSLAIAFFVLFFASWALHAMGGAKAFNEEQLQHDEAAISVWRYVTTSQFWFESMQNWQSEFIAVAAIVGCRFSCASGVPRSPSRWPNRTDTPVRKQCAGLLGNKTSISRWRRGLDDPEPGCAR